MHQCPSALQSSLEIDDEKLKQFVQIQQKHWSFRMQSHLTRYQAVIQEKNLFVNLSLDSLTVDEVSKLDLQIESISIFRENASMNY